MKPLNLSVTECAKVLGVARQTLSNLVNAKASVSVEMAYRLSKAFGSTPRTWLGMQLAFDLAHSQELEEKIKVKRVSVERGLDQKRGRLRSRGKTENPVRTRYLGLY